MKLTKNNTRLIIGIMAGLGFFSLVAALIFFAVPEGNKQVLTTICGFIGGAYVATVNYYFAASIVTGKQILILP